MPGIRDDGRIEGADPSIAALTGTIEVRFADQTLLDHPAGLLTETGTLDFSTTGVKEATVALTFRKGVT